MIWFQYYIEKRIENRFELNQTKTYCYGGAWHIGVDNTYCPPLSSMYWTWYWWAIDWNIFFQYSIPIYTAPLASDHIVHAVHIDNIMLQYIDNSTHIATSIIRISSGSICIDGYCSEILKFQYHIADALGEVLIRPHRYSKHTLSSTIRVIALNCSNLKKAIQYVLFKAIH